MLFIFLQESDHILNVFLSLYQNQSLLIDFF